jgi:hypothetical protein
VKLFNEQWFYGHLPVDEPSHEHVSVNMRMDGPSPQWRDEDDSQDHDVPIEMAEPGQDWNATTEDIYDSITASRDKFFFSGYINEQTFRPRWYLVRVAKEQQGTAPSVICSTYTVEFFAKHPSDDFLADPDSRWWPEWHEYSRSNDGVMELGRRVLMSPKATPNLNKFTMYSDNIDLISDLALIGPFNFASGSTRSKQMVELSEWVCLSDACMGRGINPPRMSTRTRERAPRTASSAIATACLTRMYSTFVVGDITLIATNKRKSTVSIIENSKRRK